jgi:glutathione peroxidase-family protein
MIAKMKGRKHSLEQRAKNSATKKAQWQTQEYREKCVKSHIGKKQSKEHVKKRMKNMMGHPNWNHRKMLIDKKGRFIKAV